MAIAVRQPVEVIGNLRQSIKSCRFLVTAINNLLSHKFATSAQFYETILKTLKTGNRGLPLAEIYCSVCIAPNIVKARA